MNTDTKDKDLICTVSPYGALLMERIQDRKPLPFLDPIERAVTLDKLLADKLIAEDKRTKSGYRLTAKGRDVCRALWGEKDGLANAP